MAIPRNLANLANQLNTDGEVPKIEVGDSKVEVTDTGTGKIEFTVDNVEIADFTTGAVVFNETGANQDFRVEGDTNANLIFADASADKVGIGTNTFNTNGGVLQVSNGISFPATQSASTDANTLDDYEEGTFTMSLQSVQSGSITFGGTDEISGLYIKVGRLVHIIAKLVVSSQSSPSGDIRFQGLPFGSSSSITYLQVPIAIQYPASASIPANTASTFFNLYPSATSSLYCYFGDNPQTPCGGAFARNGATVNFCFSYHTS